MGSDGSIMPVPIDLSDPTARFYVSLYATGLRAGRTVTATINGINMPVLFSGTQPTFAGLDQVNLGPFPMSLRGAGTVDVQVIVDGQPANTITLLFQ
jgi:uncharacterized protein (TIGR03437 family)